MIPPELYTWGLPLAFAGICIAAAFAALQINPPNADEFWIARGFFLLAGIVALARFTLFAFTSNRGFGIRVAITAVAFAVIAPLTVEAVRYVNRRHDRWLAGQSLSLTPTPQRANPKEDEKDKARPNLVDRGVRIHRAHQDIWASILVEGPNETRNWFEPDWQLLTIEICNEFRVSPKTAPVANLTAEITYTFPDGSNFKLNRGAWLSGRNRMGFNVNDHRHLIILGSLMRTPGEARIFVREYPRTAPNGYINLDAIMGDLPHNEDYSVEIKLISESEGEHYVTFNYMLSITAEGQGPISVDLVKASEWDAFQQDRASTPKAQQGEV